MQNENETKNERGFEEATADEIRQFEADLEATAQSVVDGAQKSGEADAVTIPRAEYEKLKADLAEAENRGLRALAELENFRKRAARSAEEDRKYASMDLARAILPVWDNLSRAIEAAEQAGSQDAAQGVGPEAANALLEGVKMTRREFLEILERNKIEKIDALYKPFNPIYEESLACMPNAEYPANTVIIEAQAGFKLHDRVVRPAQVVLAAGGPPAAPQKTPEVNDAPAE